MKMIIFDLDGTLLNSEEQIPNSTIEYINKIKEQEVVIMAATGRTLLETVEVESIKDICDYILSSDGASLLDVKEDNFIYNREISKEGIEKLYSIVNHEHIDTIFYSLNGEKDKMDEDDRVNKVKLFFDDNDKINYYCKKINDNYSNEYTATAMKHSSREEYWLAINNSDTDKSTGLKYLKNKLSIDKKEIISFGDRANDIPNFKESGIAVAMENAADEVKSASTHITRSNDELGVELVLRKIFDI
ncbi:MAG: HAD family hydrolase [Clostridia bacterium]|jgi:HAD superfamily hydrolase (TIGR01484 family)|nr:HAD family hydrolase [Clostridia bacterium]